MRSFPLRWKSVSVGDVADAGGHLPAHQLGVVVLRSPCRPRRAAGSFLTASTTPTMASMLPTPELAKNALSGFA